MSTEETWCISESSHSALFLPPNFSPISINRTLKFSGMALSSSSSSSALSTTDRRKYDVFINHRGADTRRNIASLLYDALRRQGLLTFWDCDDLTRGEDISTSILTAIENSKISVIIFSRNYASSPWCLDELAQIIKCKKMNGQMVMPVFYRISPRDVRQQTGSFGCAFAKYEEQGMMEKVKLWRTALKEAADLPGWDLSTAIQWSKLIKDIVMDILGKIQYQELLFIESMHFDPHVNPVATSQIQQVESLLCTKSQEVGILGIWGLGGIGKTTIARAVSKHCRVQFQCCFLVNVREKLKKHDATDLQYKPLLKILKEESPNVATLGPGSFEDQLHHAKVLIILDDVDDSVNLQGLLRGCNNLFGPGSKVLVTSRDRHVFRDVADIIYEVKGFNHMEALQLFSLYAFSANYPPSEKMKLSEKMVNYGKGNPLALTVLGSALSNGSIEHWNWLLHTLETIPNAGFQNILRVSYDGLSCEEQWLFLDIAHFFIGQDKDYVTKILDGCYTSVHNSLNILIKKSLVTLTHNKLEMHDLLQEMGLGMAYVQLPGKLKLMDLKGSNLADRYKDKRLASSKLQGRMNLFEVSSVLKITGLKYLNLSGTAIEEFPTSIGCLSDLVTLDLKNCSRLKHLPSCICELKSLRRLNLANCSILKDLPQLSKNLKSLNLSGTAIEELPPSIGYLSDLVTLDLENCSRLMHIPSCICELKSLRSLNLANCSNLKNLPQLSKNLKILNLSGTAMGELPSSIGDLSALVTLDLKNCSRLKHLPDSMHDLKSLRRLNLANCSNLKSLPQLPKKLKDLNKHGTAIEELPTAIGYPSALATLELENCSRLEHLPSCKHELESLKTLYCSGCPNLKLEMQIMNWPSYFSRLPSSNLCPANLVQLKLTYSNVEQPWAGKQPLGNLKLMDLRRSNLNRLADLSGAQRLEILNLQGCMNLVEVSSIQYLTKLEYLNLKSCKNLWSLPSMIGLKFLRNLNLSNCSNLKNLPHLSTNLKYLNLSGTAIEELPISIGCLSALVSLDLKDCSRLKHLPSCVQELESLKNLNLSGCPNLLRHLGGTGIRQVPSSVHHHSRLSAFFLLDGISLKSFITSCGSNLKLFLSFMANMGEIESCSKDLADSKTIIKTRIKCLAANLAFCTLLIFMILMIQLLLPLEDR